MNYKLILLICYNNKLLLLLLGKIYNFSFDKINNFIWVLLAQKFAHRSSGSFARQA